MKLIYLSPHLDDAIYSCGGRIWQDVQRGDDVEIWTIFAGDTPADLTPFARELHTRWGAGPEAVSQRREEDRAACRILGASHRHLAFPDCIYRRFADNGEPVIRTNEDLFKPVHPGEAGLVQQIRDEVLCLNPERLPVFCPLGIGGHLDHRITRAAAEATGLPLVYYADFPYAAEASIDIAPFIPLTSKPESYRLDDASIEKWADSVEAYSSQLSSFWSSAGEMRSAIRSYAQKVPGRTLWKCKPAGGVQ